MPSTTSLQPAEVKGYRTTLFVGLVATFALVRVVCELLATTPELAMTPGFTEAMDHLAAHHPSAIVVVPPLQTAALDHVPLHLVATDAVPSDGNERARVVYVRHHGDALPPELRDERVETQRFGEIDVVRVDRAP